MNNMESNTAAGAQDREDSLPLSMHGVFKSFRQGETHLQVLDDIALTIHRGEIVALVGPSGSGKTTLLNVAGLLEKPDEGRVTINGLNTHRLRDKAMSKLRRDHIGFVFQFHRLLPEFSAFENILIPQLMNGLDRHIAEERAKELLEMVGLEKRRDHRPGQLSGGEQQRVAIARATSNAPSILLADEPTGNLDHETAADVFQHLSVILKSVNTSALIVTHNQELAEKMDRVVTIRNGRLVE